MLHVHRNVILYSSIGLLTSFSSFGDADSTADQVILSHGDEFYGSLLSKLAKASKTIREFTLDHPGRAVQKDLSFFERLTLSIGIDNLILERIGNGSTTPVTGADCLADNSQLLADLNESLLQGSDIQLGSTYSGDITGEPFYQNLVQEYGKAFSDIIQAAKNSANPSSTGQNFMTVRKLGISVGLVQKIVDRNDTGPDCPRATKQLADHHLALQFNT